MQRQGGTPQPWRLSLLSLLFDRPQSLTSAQRAQLFNNMAGSNQIETLTDAATVTPNFGNGLLVKFLVMGTAGTNRTIGLPTNGIPGETYLMLLQQDGTGGRTVSYASGINFGAAGAPALSTAAGKTDVIGLLCISPTSYLAFYMGKGF